MTAPVRAFAGLILLLLLAGGATAGDFSTFRPIGFSDDGSVFAFEEFGIQDGSGFPYSNIYFIDTEKDTFLAGTPIRIRLDDEAAGLEDARAESREKARPLVERHRLFSNPGVLAAFNPMGEITADRHRIEYLPHAVEPTPGGSYALALDEIALDLPEKCTNLTPEGGKGFRLRLVRRDGEDINRTIHEDTRIPDSRHCPLSYQIAGAMIHHAFGSDPVHIALVLVRSFGFEGSDGRWIAVSFKP